MSVISKQDRAYIENKYHRIAEPFNAFDRMRYHGGDYDMSTGSGDDHIKQILRDTMEKYKEKPHCIRKARAFECILDHSPVAVNACDWFVGFYSWGRLAAETTVQPWQKEAYSRFTEKTSRFLKESKAAAQTDIWLDYDHSVPDWEALLTLGFTGILSRSEQCRKKAEIAGITPEQKAFYESIRIEYNAILRLLERMETMARRQENIKARHMAECLYNLRTGAPKTTLDALQLVYLYFLLSECVDNLQVRSLASGLDSLCSFYENDLNTGKFSKDQITEFLAHFLMQFSAIGNYWGHPFYLGGSDPEGKTKVNDFSRLILDTYKELGIYNPKIQILYDSQTPEDFLRQALKMIISGSSGVVFICAENAQKALESIGELKEDAADFDVKGCYEYEARGKGVSTAPAYINLPQPVLDTLFSGEDYSDFEAFKAAYIRRINKLFSDTTAAINEMEQYLEYVNPAVMFSATIMSSITQGRDAYQAGSVYNNTAFVVSGLATAVDSLMAVREVVYEQHLMTLAELADTLKNNLEGQEKLRMLIQRDPRKYGSHDRLADACANALLDEVLRWQGVPNIRGGVYKIAIHSARHFLRFGQQMGATPDGRLAGEETSKNGSPSVGMDREGCTCLISSVCATGPDRFAESHCLDIMLHPSAVSGPDGDKILQAILEVYRLNHGSAIQFNIFDEAMLRDAQYHPERYKNLQVRVCGWNVLFNNMDRVEQESYIRRASGIRN